MAAETGAGDPAIDLVARVADLERENALLRARLGEAERGEEHLRLILESATDYAIFTLDRAGFVTSWNDGARRLLGYAEEEILGRDGRIIFTPEDVASGAADRELESALATGRAENERWHLRKDGSRFWGSGLVMMLRNGGPTPGLLKIMRDRTDRRRADEMKQLLIDELNHRVKNALAVVQSLAEQTLRTAESPRAFAVAFGNRLQALADAHDLLTREAWVGVQLRDIAQATLDGWIGDGRVVLSGPEVRVGPKPALALSMAFHELATNAAKYGALSVPEGRVTLAWTDGDECEVMWVESGGPRVSAPIRQGFGSRILQRALALELDRPVDLRFEPTGVTCAFRFEAAAGPGPATTNGEQ